MPDDASTTARISPTSYVHAPTTGEHRHAVSQAVTINKPREELYRFWRDPSNLARVMENIERIEVLDERRSHWTVKGPAGTTVEFDSVIIDDQPGDFIAWHSENADVDNAGWIEFRDGPTGRGTEVRAFISYDPPLGTVGKVMAKALQREPNQQARRDLRRFKQLMETGEISTAKAPHAAPRGSHL